jgi:hypothetical protein
MISLPFNVNVTRKQKQAKQWQSLLGPHFEPEFQTPSIVRCSGYHTGETAALKLCACYTSQHQANMLTEKVVVHIGETAVLKPCACYTRQHQANMLTGEVGVHIGETAVLKPRVPTTHFNTRQTCLRGRSECTLARRQPSSREVATHVNIRQTCLRVRSERKLG